MDLAEFRRKGWAVTPILDVKVADALADRVRLEALYCVFHSQWPKLEAMTAQGLNPTKLLVDPKLRETWLDDPKMVWRGHDPHKPIISKNCGMVNIYHQPDIREHVLFNPAIIERCRTLYAAMPDVRNGVPPAGGAGTPSGSPEGVPVAVPQLHPTGRSDERMIYLHGPDRLCLKPQGATDMPIHIDSNPSYRCMDQWPHYRLQSFVTLRIHPSSDPKYTMRNVGSVELLEGFHHYYELFGYYLKAMGEPPFVGPGPHQLQPILDTYLDTFLIWVQTYIYGASVKPPEIAVLTTLLPVAYVAPKWVCPAITTGDLFSFDWRLPHRNTKNQSPTDRIVAYVSLYRGSDWKGREIKPIFEGKLASPSTHVGSNLHNTEERELFKTVWEQRTHIDTSAAHVKEVLNITT